MLFWTALGERLTINAAVLDGDDGFNANSHLSPSVAVQVEIRPFTGLVAVLSGFRTGRLGSASEPAESALEFGGTHGVVFGHDSDVANYQDGVEVADDPEAALEDLWAWEADLVLSGSDVGQLWTSVGQAYFKSAGDSTYDRSFTYWVVEGMAELGWIHRGLRPVYLAGRYSGMSTFNTEQGYILEAMNNGDAFGFNTQEATAISAGVGWRINENLRLKFEYCVVRFDLVSGVPDAMDAQTDKRNFGMLGVSAKW